MITTGFALATITSVGFMFVYFKLPVKVRQFIQKHTLLTDAVAMLLTYALLGGTLVALFAAAFIGIITSVMLALASDPRTAAIMERIVIKLKELKETAINWLGEQAAQLAPAAE